MQNNFDLSLKYVLRDEGGNSDDPRDHGGRTSRGITQREYDSWCSLGGNTKKDVWTASDADVRSIYHDQYWDPYCDKLPSGVDYIYFDMSVNTGRTQATRTLQKALGVSVDGMFGQVTLDAVNNADASELISAISERRRDFYRSLKQFNVYGKGWISRVDHAEVAAKAMSQNVEHDKPAAPSVKPTAPNTPSVSPETSATATGGILAILAGFKEDLQNLASSIPNLNYIILGVVVLGVGYTLYGMWKNNKINQVL